jgi:hypothetical protein
MYIYKYRSVRTSPQTVNQARCVSCSRVTQELVLPELAASNIGWVWTVGCHTCERVMFTVDGIVMRHKVVSKWRLGTFCTIIVLYIVNNTAPIIDLGGQSAYSCSNCSRLQISPIEKTVPRRSTKLVSVSVLTFHYIRYVATYPLHFSHKC